MNKIIKLLSYFLILQFLLFLAVFYFSGQLKNAPEVQFLIDKTDKQNITKIILEGSGNTKVTLIKKDGSWSQPIFNNFPANDQAVDQLLTRLVEIKKGVQVSIQETSFERLKVSDNTFERKVSLYNDNTLIDEIYFGSAPSLRQAHARKSSEKSVFAVKFAANDIDVRPSDWIKKDILVISKKEIKTVTTPEVFLERIEISSIDKNNSSDEIQSDEPVIQWSIKKIKKNQMVNQENVKELITQLADMRINSIATQKDIKKIDPSVKKIKIKITLLNDSYFTYELAKIRDEEEFLLFNSSRDEVFLLPPLSGKELVNSIKKSFLIANKE